MTHHGTQIMSVSTVSKGLTPLTFLAFLALPLSASAGQPDTIDAGLDEPNTEVWGGQETEPCAFPPVVRVTGPNSLCSGTLIHPKVVMYAAHCGTEDHVVRFGDSSNSTKTRATEYCRANPQYTGQSQTNDWAYCVLEEAVTEIPFTPVGYGCEVDEYYYSGQSVAVVGFGNNEGDSGAGRKRWAFTTMSNLMPGRFNVGGQGQPTICSGDSGGPAYIRYDDGTWHTYGIASTKNSGTCDSASGTHSLAVNTLPWIESDSGIDVTVCHDINGNWDPGPNCGNFFNGQPALSYGSWNTWCKDATALEWSDTCGSSFKDQNFESNPPFLQVQIPFDGQVFEGGSANFDITVVADDDSGLPVDVSLVVDGEAIPQVIGESPAIWGDAVFPVGEYTIVATGMDFWGNEASVDVTFTVVEDEDDGDDDGDDGETTTTETGGGDEVGGESGEPGDGGGTTDVGLDGGQVYDVSCSCSTEPGRGGGGALWGGLSLLGLLALRRRR